MSDTMERSSRLSEALRAAAALGRGSDQMLAHISPHEARLLEFFGGSGSVNPHTGLREFDTSGSSSLPTTGIFTPQPYGGPTGVLPSDLPAWSDAGGVPPGFKAVESGAAIPQYVANWDSGGANLPVQPILGSWEMGGQTNYGYYTPGWTTSSSGNEQSAGGFKVPGQFTAVGVPYDPSVNPSNLYNNLGVVLPGDATPYGQPDYTFTPEGAIPTAAGNRWSSAVDATTVWDPKTLLGFLVPLTAGAGVLAAGALGAGAAGAGAGAAAGAEGAAAAGEIGAGAGASAGALESLGAISGADAASLGAGAGFAAGLPEVGAAAEAAGGLGAVGGITEASDAASLGSGAGFSAGLPSAGAGDVVGAGGAGAAADAASGLNLGGGFSDISAVGDVAQGAGDLTVASDQPIFLGATSSEQIAAPSGLGPTASGFDATSGFDLTAPSVGTPVEGTVDAGAFDLPASGGGGSSGSFLSRITDSLGLKDIGGALKDIKPLTDIAGLGISGYGLLKNLSAQNAKGGPIAGLTGGQQLQTIANQAAAQGSVLQNYLTSGTLPPAVQASVDAATADGITSIKSNYAARGIPPNSSMEVQDIARLKQNAVIQGATLADQLLQQGITETQLSANIYQSLLSTDLNLSQQTGQAIANLAAALSGNRTIKLA